MTGVQTCALPICPTAEIDKVHVKRFAPWFETSDEQVNTLQILL